jgi:hypothetical protein
MARKAPPQVAKAARKARQRAREAADATRRPARKAAAPPTKAQRKAAARQVSPAPAPKRAKRLTPLKDLSPAYAARVRAKAKKLGITVKQLRAMPGVARGHKPAEHKTRRENQISRIEAFAERQSHRGGAHGARSPDEIVATLVEMIGQYGMKWFRRLELKIESLHKEFQNNGQETVYGMDYLDSMAELYEMPRQELFYH